MQPESLVERERRARKRAEVVARIAVGPAFCIKGHRLTERTIGYDGRCSMCRSEQRKVNSTPHVMLCKHGHERTPENIDKHGRCIECRRTTNQRYVQRVMADPVRRAERLEYHRIYKEAKRRASGVPARNWGGRNNRLPKSASGWGESVDAAPLLAWLRDVDASALCRTAGVNPRRLYAIQSGEQDSVSLHTVDRLLFAAGEEYRLLELYPVGV